MEVSEFSRNASFQLPPQQMIYTYKYYWTIQEKVPLVPSQLIIVRDLSISFERQIVLEGKTERKRDLPSTDSLS